MRKFFICFSLLFICIKAHSAEMNDVRLPGLNQTVAGAFMSSNTIASIIASTGGVFVSTYSAYLHAVVINKPGIGSTLDIYNSCLGTTTYERQIASILTSTNTSVTSFPPVTLTYDAFCSSCIAINPLGPTAANITILWRQK